MRMLPWASVPMLVLSGAGPSGDVHVVSLTTVCDTPGHHAFDFWLGTWDVHTRERGLVGTNRISSVHGGCALREEYEGKTGYRGSSINAYDHGRGRWHQTWIDTGGLLLQVHGGLEEKKMILQGARLKETGDTVWDRITWEPLPDGTVRQLWENGPGATAPWTVIFEGSYRRRL